MTIFDGYHIEKKFERLFKPQEFGRGGPFDSDQFINGNPRNLSRALELVGNLLLKKAEAINWLPDEKEERTNSPYHAVLFSAEKLVRVAEQMKDLKSPEPQDYHWVIISELCSIIAGLSEKIDNLEKK